jgi:PiT family inorganic phosphate transporter
MIVGVVIVMVLVSCSIFVNGWTDAPNAIATVVSTRVLRPRVAVMMAAACNLLGVMISVLLTGSAVAATISTIVNFDHPGKEGLVILAAAQFSIVLWSTIAWKFGLPTSESHGLIAGLTGAGLAYGGFGSLNLSSWTKVLIGLGFSSVAGFVIAVLATWLIILIFRRINRRSADVFFSYGQVCSSILMAYNHGAQDGQKFLGIYALALMLGGIIPMSNTLNDMPLWAPFCVSAIMCLGTSIGGYRIISKMGMDMVKLEKYQGFSAEMGASLLILIATPLGIPLSTTQTKATAIMGAGAARRLSGVNWSVAKELFIAWGLTFPISIAIGFIMTKIFMLIF